MSSDAMKTVQKLIRQQRYDEARALLLTLNHPLARAWLESIDKLESHAPLSPQAVRRRWWLALAVVVVVVVVGLLLYRNATRQPVGLPDQMQQALNSYTDWNAECARRGYTQAECDQWKVQQALSEKPVGTIAPGATLPFGAKSK